MKSKKSNKDNKTSVIGVISIKGGVGKTSCVTSLGAAIAHEFNKKVLIVDANFSAPNLGLHVGLVDPSRTVHHVLNNEIKPQEAIYPFSEQLHIMPASIVPKKTKPLQLKNKLESIKDDYDVILIDSSPSLNDEMLATISASDNLLVVTSPDYPTLSCTLHAVKVAKQRKTPIMGLVLNRTRNKSFELSIADIEDAAKSPVLAVIPDDVNMLAALSTTQPVILHSPQANAAVEFKKLAAALIGENYSDSRIMSRLKGLFNREMPIDEVNRYILKDEIARRNI